MNDISLYISCKIKAETALSVAISNTSQAQKELEINALSFERKKLEDIKKILHEYVLLEIAEHAKAIEIFTKAFHEISFINVNSDLSVRE